mmetsp:Transcript_104560/g.292992  ORF Transcript_104560/g.292992 Transcript_104560/m.292992 type:complete len:224 (+) Transcript_104560:912-1583(+)
MGMAVGWAKPPMATVIGTPQPPTPEAIPFCAFMEPPRATAWLLSFQIAPWWPWFAMSRPRSPAPRPLPPRRRPPPQALPLPSAPSSSSPPCRGKCWPWCNVCSACPPLLPPLEPPPLFACCCWRGTCVDGGPRNKCRDPVIPWLFKPEAPPPAPPFGFALRAECAEGADEDVARTSPLDFAAAGGGPCKPPFEELCTGTGTVPPPCDANVPPLTAARSALGFA